MPDPQITLRVVGQGVEILDQTGEKIASLNNTAQNSKGGLQAFGDGALQAYAAMKLIESTFTQTYNLIDGTNQLGVNALRAGENLRTFGGDITSLHSASGGLIDDMTLASDAVTMLSMGVAKSQTDVQNIIHLGSELGEQFAGNAATGVDELGQALERVGSKRSLYALQLDTNAVMATYKELRSTLGDEGAWHTAVLDAVTAKVGQMGDALNKTGTAWERLKSGISDVAQQGAQNVATGLEAIVNAMSAYGEAMGASYVKATTGVDYYQATAHQGEAAIPPAPGGVGAFSQQSMAGTGDPLTLQIQAAASAQQTYNTTVAETANTYTLAYQRAQELKVELDDQNQQLTIQKALNTENTSVRQGEVALINQQAAAAQQVTAAQNELLSLQRQGEISSQNAVKSYQTMAQAFDIKPSSQIGGEVGGDIGSLFATRRRAEIKEYGGTDNTAVKAYDTASQQAQNAYLLATGQTTVAMIEENKQITDLKQSFADGSISAGALATGLALIANNAQAGKNELSDLANQAKALQIIEQQSRNEQAQSYGFFQYGGKTYGGSGALTNQRQGELDLTTTATTAGSASGAFDKVTQSADLAKTHIGAAGAAGSQAGSDIAAGMDMAAAHTAAANQQLLAYVATLGLARFLGGHG